MRQENDEKAERAARRIEQLKQDSIDDKMISQSKPFVPFVTLQFRKFVAATSCGKIPSKRSAYQAFGESDADTRHPDDICRGNKQEVIEPKVFLKLSNMKETSDNPKDAQESKSRVALECKDKENSSKLSQTSCNEQLTPPNSEDADFQHTSMKKKGSKGTSLKNEKKPKSSTDCDIESLKEKLRSLFKSEDTKNKVTVSDLKLFLSSVKLPVSGKKEILVERARKALETSS
ncbi:hypothetical protein GUITHDRAFT_119911 [Guillardia theta CCMP2712]|uniref:SAP domain-containing protein n=1 Tax=Guillardia theta (strain CCMP2712) TaxID=905079 RepID=L1IDG6_GUITC|nr:hypothetical protein GUITHDRAFT_119911 [Guillardia theta CCMP2712]EKX33865.1 hypothetical protein GUITHDRAFT_119911 [Guillardia theta CCMP2712]|eukprot:XP_005820845.1 hypothetical protein GUITHDRAFT_119911 [Guillardia theta CCMP2712]